MPQYCVLKSCCPRFAVVVVVLRSLHLYTRRQGQRCWICHLRFQGRLHYLQLLSSTVCVCCVCVCVVSQLVCVNALAIVVVATVRCVFLNYAKKKYNKKRKRKKIQNEKQNLRSNCSANRPDKEFLSLPCL